MKPSDRFDGEKYLNLETFRKSGAGVKTPVWFAELDGVLYIYTLADSGKAKRLRNNPRVRAAPCDIRGNVHGDWADGEARLIPAGEAREADRLLSRKYWMKRLFDWTSRLRRQQRVYISVTLR